MLLTPGILFCTQATPWGTVVLAADGSALWGVWFKGQARFPAASQVVAANRHPVLQTASRQLQAYCSGDTTAFDLPLSHLGTPFQQQVRRSVATIPFGKHCSYQDIAKDIGKPDAVRAVANAIAHNRWLLVIPCHRVLGSHGKLTGYSAGLERKAALLQFENSL